MRTNHYRPYHPAWWLLGAITLYRRFLSPRLGANCRYLPTCSAYAIEAIDVHGSARGLWLAIRRVGRCHPFHSGGHDPVPGTDVTDPRSIEEGSPL